MLRIDNLHATVADKPILNGLTLHVPAGEVHAIMGPNGAGKSTLAYVLGGRPGYDVTAGSATFDGQDLLALEPHERATAGLFLAHGGRDPETGFSVVSAERARRINALMLTCGHYDGSGEFAYRVGLPGKSGVGGGILAVAPGRASIAVWAPGLDAAGNSHLGRIALERLARRMGWSIFG